MRARYINNERAKKIGSSDKEKDSDRKTKFKRCRLNKKERNR